MGTPVRSRYRCSWVYPYCTSGALRWIGKIPLCDDHYGQALIAVRAFGSQAPVPAPRLITWPSVVYYVTWPGRYDSEVKIGVSTHLPQRLQGLRRRGAAPEALVAEPGDHKLERHRHREFRSLRLLDAAGSATEIFRRVPLLDEHINRLRSTCPDWAVYAKL